MIRLQIYIVDLGAKGGGHFRVYGRALRNGEGLFRVCSSHVKGSNATHGLVCACVARRRIRHGRKTVTDRRRGGYKLLGSITFGTPKGKAPQAARLSVRRVS